MNRRHFLASAAAGAAAVPLAAEETTAASLFDGKTLRGWHVVDGPEGAFYVRDGAIAVSDNGDYPAWLRSDRQYENFDLRGEFYIKGWIDSGIYIHAPEHGRAMYCGKEIHIFSQNDEKPAVESMGSIFPLVAPLKTNVKVKAEWNKFRILMDWPRLRVWTNEEPIQDVDLTGMRELALRPRQGYLGLQSLSYPIMFRNLTIRELPGKEKWETLYGGPEDFSKWTVSEGQPRFDALGGVLRGAGVGHLATKDRFQDFELSLYVRHSLHHNSGVLFRTAGQGLRGTHYEIQLHDVEAAHYPTGSLYYYKRAMYPRIRAEEWWPMQLIAQGPNCTVRINGDTVLEYDRLENQQPGAIELQCHHEGSWQEFKQIRVRRL